jgi:hypothetical protein
MGGVARIPDPADSISGIVRWEPPEDDVVDEFADAKIPVFVPGIRAESSAPAPVDESYSFIPEPDESWKFEGISEPPPPAPKGQWWAAWLPDPRQRHEFRYWDGSNWTDHVSDSGMAGIDPV